MSDTYSADPIFGMAGVPEGMKPVPREMNVPAQQAWGARAVPQALGELSGVSDAARAARGEMTPDEQRNFAMGAAVGLLPGARPVAKAAKALREPIAAVAARAAEMRPIQRTLPAAREFVGTVRPEEAPFPHLGERYPEVGPPELKVDEKKGTTYLGKTQTPEEAAFYEARGNIQRDLKEGKYTPYFDPDKRFDLDPSGAPAGATAEVKTKPGVRPATLEQWRQMANDPAAHQRLREAFEHGQSVGGGDRWYQIGQLHNEFRKELGQEAGDRKFGEFVRAMAGTTAGLPPESNLAAAHLIRYARQNGIPLPEAPYAVPAPVRGGRYGIMPNIRQGEKFMEAGAVDPATNPKPFNFEQNFWGNANVATLDEQMGNIMFGRGTPAPFAKSGSPGTYGMFEPAIKKLAAEYGVTPREFQEVAWAGYKNKEEGYMPKPFITTVNEAIERTHRLTGKPRDEIVRRGLIRGETPLYGITGALGLGAAGHALDDR